MEMISNWKQIPVYEAIDGKAIFEGNFVKAQLPAEHYAVVRIEGSMEGLKPGKVYEMNFHKTLQEGVSLEVHMFFTNAKGERTFSIHGEKGLRFDVPADAVKLEMGLTFHAYHGGYGEFFGLSFTEIGEYQPRIVKLAAVAASYPGEPYSGAWEHSYEKNISVSAAQIDRAAKDGADLVLLTETYNTCFVPESGGNAGAAKMSDPAVRMLSEKAKEHHMFVAASLRLEQEGLRSNTALLFDREGELVGKYTKTHLTVGEIWDGMVPGEEIPVFDTEIGKIGFSICWDLFFPEQSRVLFLKGAEIILNPTAGTCTDLHNAINYHNDLFILTAHRNAVPGDIWKTRITDPSGNIVKSATTEDAYVCAEIDLNRHYPVWWLSYPDSMTEPSSVYKAERRPDLYGELVAPKA